MGSVFARSHPFVDGNKRTAFVVAQILLGLNGYEIGATEEEVEEVLIRLAGGKLSEKKLADWIREHMKEAPPYEQTGDLAGD